MLSSFETCFAITCSSKDQVGHKLQSVLRANPKKARPSLRKSSSGASEATTTARPTEQQYDNHKALLREVWEIPSDSEIELLDRPMASNTHSATAATWHIQLLTCLV